MCRSGLGVLRRSYEGWGGCGCDGGVAEEGVTGVVFWVVSSGFGVLGQRRGGVALDGVVRMLELGERRKWGWDLSEVISLAPLPGMDVEIPARSGHNSL
ncbi:hypothetical protein QQ045_010126 [Rhodiola kirilowii]